MRLQEFTEEPLTEKAPPGMEDVVMSLKKQYPNDYKKVFATAWAIYNKKHGKKPKTESVNEAGPEWIKHPTRPGVMVKNPKWTPKVKAPSSGQNRINATAARKAETEKKLQQLHMFMVRKIGEFFPDADPTEDVIKYARRLFGMDEWVDPWKYINAAVRKYEDQKTLSDWLADMWEQYSDQAVYDAKNGYVDNQSPFYRVGDDGTIEPETNPWRS